MTICGAERVSEKRRYANGVNSRAWLGAEREPTRRDQLPWITASNRQPSFACVALITVEQVNARRVPRLLLSCSA